MSKPYISYIDPATMKDAAMLAELERCRSYGTPRPESQAIRAHVPAVFWSFANSWRDVFHTGVADHAIKELCRLYVSRSVLCEFCGNQRSIKAARTAQWRRATRPKKRSSAPKHRPITGRRRSRKCRPRSNCFCSTQSYEFVMPGHSRPKDGVAALAYVPGIHTLLCYRGRRGWPG